MQAVRQFTAATAAALHKRIYSYSIFHIFFEQYLSVGLEACWLLGGALVSVTLVCAVLTASAGAALVILVVLIMLQIDLLAVMSVWGIQLNAVSLVNLAATSCTRLWLPRGRARREPGGPCGTAAPLCSVASF